MGEWIGTWMAWSADGSAVRDPVVGWRVGSVVSYIDALSRV